MTESTPVNIVAFMPIAGGSGVRLSVTTASTTVALPGLAGGQQGTATRVMVSNGGSVSAFIKFGGSTITANTSGYEILPGTKELLSPPYNGIGGGPIYIAAVTASGSTSINACVGEGT